jgi:DNA polymerase I
MTMTETRLPPRGGVLDDVTLHHVTDMATLDQFRGWMGERHHGQVCTDTESAGLNPHRDRHRKTQIGDKAHGWAFRPDWMGAAHEALARYPGRIGAFNWPYDHRVLWHQSGLWLPWAQLDDAQLVCHIVDSAAINKLKPRTARDIDPSAMVGERALAETMKARHDTWATIPDDLPEYWMYAAMDPVEVSWLLDKHLPVVTSRWAASYDLELAYNRLTAQMMSAGMMIDQPYIAHWTALTTEWNERAMDWLRENYGITSVEKHAEVGAVLEANGVVIDKRTRNGQAVVDKAQMEHYAATFPHAAELISHIRWAKKSQAILGRYLTKFTEMAVDGVIHASIHSTGAQRTGRNSVTGPPMQTFDRDVPVIRGSFIPPPGYCFVSWDAAQIEARLAAHFSGDPQMIADFRMCDESGQSFFVNMASRIYGTKISKRDPRYTMTKNTVYATIYGSGLETAAATAGVSLAQLAPIYNGFKAMYPVLARRSRRLIDSLKYTSRGRQPRVKTLTGRELVVDRGREYAGVDYEIQGSAAEVCKYGAVALDAAGYGDLLRLTIHDEILALAPIGDAEDVLRAGTEILTDTSSFRLPIPWEGAIMRERWVKAA